MNLKGLKDEEIVETVNEVAEISNEIKELEGSKEEIQKTVGIKK